MDPNETLKAIDEFLAMQHTGAEVDEWCQDLFGWLAKGGFKLDWLVYELGTSYYRCRCVSMLRCRKFKD